MPVREPGVFHLPRTTGELRSFVAHFGARCAGARATCSLENVVLRAVETSRRDPALARMLPVFLWRVRGNLKLDELAAKASHRGCGHVLGYFLDVAGKVSSTRTFRPAVRALRRHARPDRPVFLFPKTAKHPFEAMATQEHTPPDARRWGLLTRMPLDCYSSYFAKVATL